MGKFMAMGLHDFIIYIFCRKNNVGQVGNPERDLYNETVLVSCCEGKLATQINAGYRFSMVLTGDGAV